MPAIFNGSQLDPIQSVSVSQQTQFLTSGKLSEYLFNISVKGKIVASQSAKTATKHAYILAQQQAINSTCAYSSDGEKKDFSFTSRNGTGAFSCSGRIKSVSFDEGIWVDYSDYTIEMEADSFVYNGVKVPAANQINLNFDESWTVEVNDEDNRFTKVSHKISSKCKDVNVGGIWEPGWKKAKAKVDANIASTIPNDISSATAGTFSNSHNKKISYRVNISTGEVSADIELSYHNPASGEAALATHEQTITQKHDSNSFRGTTSISGTISGLNGGGNDRYGPASGLWETVKAALIATYATVTIVSTSESHDEIKGIINYDYQIEDYPKPTDGSKSKKVNITEMGPLAAPPDTYVTHQTIYGNGGPLFQDIGIKKVRTKTVTIEVVSLTDLTLNTLEYAPSVAKYIIESDNIQKNLAAGKTTRTTVFIWE
jgi:hypothetical protein